MNYVLIDSTRKVFSFDPYTNSYYFADSQNDDQIELINSLHEAVFSHYETLKLYTSIAGRLLWLSPILAE